MKRSSVFTGNRLVSNLIVNAKGSEVARIVGQRIITTDGKADQFWIDDGYIFGPVDHGLFFIDHDDKIFGPRTELPWERESESS